MKPFLRSLKYATALSAVTAMATMLSSCGDPAGSRETVYLNVFNAYPGASQMSLYGPSGRVIHGLPYSGRTITPVEINRNLGTQFTLVIDGAPQPIDLDFELFSLYPQETGTLLFRRRADTDAASAHIYRHTPSISGQCRLVIDNALSLQSTDLANYNFMAAFRYENIEQAGFTGNDPRGSSFLQRIRDNPYFFFVQHPDIQGALLPIWVGDSPDRPSSVDYQSGVVNGHPPTVQVLECIGEEEATPEIIEDCTRPETYSGTIYVPDQPTIDILDVVPNNGECSLRFRIYSDFSNIFEGQHGNGNYIEDTVTFYPGEHMFWVLYGRPIDAKIERWTSADPDTGGGFVDLPQD